MSDTNLAMAGAVEEFDPMEIEVDPETGEIIEPRQFGHGDIPRIGERINYLRKMIEALLWEKHPINLYIDKLLCRRNEQIERLQKQISYFLSVAQPHVDTTSDRKIVLAGIGRFRYRKGNKVVDTSRYDELEGYEKSKVEAEYGNLFNVKTTTVPDKKAIKHVIESDLAAPGFKLIQKPDTFEFKGE